MIKIHNKTNTIIYMKLEEYSFYLAQGMNRRVLPKSDNSRKMYRSNHRFWKLFLCLLFLEI